MIEKKERPDWLEAHGKESTPNPDNFGYVPLPTSVEGEPQGSVYMAHLRQENTIGSLLNRKSMSNLSGDSQEDYDFTNYVNRIPKNHLNNADKYFGATTDAEFQSITDQLDQEIKDKSLLAANPWKALAYALDPLEPTNWLPGSTIYKEAKGGAAIARSMMGASLSAVASTGLQEGILHQNQLTRTMQESIFNTIGAGLVGGILGGTASAFGSKKLGKALGAEELRTQQRIVEDVNDAISPNESLSAARSNIMDGNELARMPKTVAKSMILTQMNRLLNSPFKTARWFGSTAYEHGYELAKNGGGVATPTSLEMAIKMETQKLGNIQIEHMNHFYEMHGVTSKYFKATRKKMQELGQESPLNINLDQFNRAVYQVALTGAEHELPQINNSAKMWRKYFDDIKDQAVALDMLAEDVQVPNAVNHVMIMYNKNLIIEQGGRAARTSDSFPVHLYDQFHESNEATKQFMESPLYTEAQAQIKEINIRLKKRASKGHAKNLSEAKLAHKAKIKELNAARKLVGKETPKLAEEFQLNSKTIEDFPESKEVLETIKSMNERLHNVDEDIKKVDADIAKEKAHLTDSLSAEEKAAIEKRIDDLEYKRDYIDIEVRYDYEFDYAEAWDYIYNLINQGDIPRAEFFNAAATENIYIPHSKDRLASSLKADLMAFKKLQSKIIKSSKSAPTPEHISKLEKEIADAESRINSLTSERVSPKEKEQLRERLAEIEKRILDEAPQAAKTWDGKLHSVIEGDGIQTTEELIWDQVGQTIDNILGDSDGKLLNPYLSKLSGSPQPLKARKLIIDQLQASPWHITDIQKIADAYTRAMIPSIKLKEFAKSHGFKDVDDFLIGMEDSIKKERNTALEGKTGKEAQKIRAQYDSAINDMKATIQMLQGVYGQGFNVLNSKGAEFFNNIMNWNYTRMLGHMTLASLPDMTRLVMKNPIMHVLAQGIGDSFSTVKKMNKNDVRAMGYAIATEQASLFKTYVEHHGLSTNPSPFTKGITSLARNFGNLSLMNPFQDMVQNMAGHIAINKVLDIIHRSVDGVKVSKKEITLLARLGIGKEHYADIAKFTKDKIHDGTRFSDWANWDIKTGSESQASRAFQTAIGRSIEEITVNPRLGDKPLLLQQKGAFGNFTNLFFQFKSYMFAATNRILYSGIQNRNDINMYLGAVAMMGMGMLGYVTSSVFRGSSEQLDLSPTNLILEGVDRSGVLGVFGEIISLGRKQLQLGEVSRYKSRDAFGSLLGPTGGSASELISLFNKINPLSSAKGEWTTKDASIIMKLMPLQNLFYLQSINRALFHKAAEGLGATRVDD